MTSSNTFRNRHLVATLRDPISPRRTKPYAVTIPVSPPHYEFPFTASGVLTWGTANIPDGAPVFTKLDVNNWQGDGTSSTGQVYRVNITWDGTALNYTISFFIKFSGVNRQVAGTPNFSSVGAIPWASSVIAWPTTMQPNLVGNCQWKINTPYGV